MIIDCVRVQKGEKVRSAPGGPVMEVRAVGDTLAICEWQAEGVLKQEIFGVSELMPVVAGQQAQQPQPTPAPPK